MWRHHLATPWAEVPVDEVTPAAVRSWHAKAGRTTGPTAAAQSYRLLRAITNVAVADQVIASNPCRLRGAGRPKASRPSRALTAAEALQLAEQPGRDRRTERYRGLLLVLAFGGLRFGEASALRRSDVLSGGRLRIQRSVRRGEGAVGGRRAHDRRRTSDRDPAECGAAVLGERDVAIARPRRHARRSQRVLDG